MQRTMHGGVSLVRYTVHGSGTVYYLLVQGAPAQKRGGVHRYCVYYLASIGPSLQLASILCIGYTALGHRHQSGSIAHFDYRIYVMLSDVRYTYLLFLACISCAYALTHMLIIHRCIVCVSYTQHILLLYSFSLMVISQLLTMTTRHSVARYDQMAS